MNKILLFYISLFMCGCTWQKQKQDFYENIPSMETVTKDLEIIDVENAKEICEADFFSQYVKEVKFVTLDNKHPLFAIEKLNVIDNTVYALSCDKIFVYNAEDGSYKYTIEHKGKGNNEYLNLRDFQVQPNKNSIVGVADMQRKILHFSINDGHVESTSPMMIGSPYMRDFCGRFVHYLSNGCDYNDGETWQILVADSSKFIYKNFPMLPIQRGYLSNGLYDNDSCITFIPMYGDTIYKISRDFKLCPTYLIHNKHGAWTEHNQELAREDLAKLFANRKISYLKSDEFIETDGVILFAMLEFKTGTEVIQYYLYDKKKKITLRIVTGEFPQLSDCLAAFPSRLYHSDKNIAYGLYHDAYSLRIYLEYGMITNKYLKDIIEQAKLGDNPILVKIVL